jgi:pyruvate kinase
MEKLTKIVATISDKNCSVKFLEELYAAGMNVVRLNTAHQTYDDTLKVIQNVRKVSDQIALLLDTKGPEIRTTIANTEIHVKSGDMISVKGAPEQNTTKDMICVDYQRFEEDIPINSKILIDDGEIELLVIDKKNDYLKCEVRNEGIIEGRKSINIPSVHIKLPALTEKDKGYIRFAIENDLDFIAHSFVRNKEDVLSVQKILDEAGSPIKIIAKIENQDGINNIDEILDYAYGVMIARGDLAIEVPRERIPFIQKKIISKCIKKRKPVIVATQMLHSMIKNPRPTRAEVSDIATAIFDGTDAIMLSGETAYGKYPLEAVETMTQIALEIEKQKEKYIESKFVVITNKTSAYLCKAAVKSAIRLNAKAIIADTAAGHTIRNLSGYRGQVKIFALAYKKHIMRELALSYGIYASFIEPLNSTDEFLEFSIEKLVQENLLKLSDRVVFLAGSFRKSKGANFIQISKAKEILSDEK